MLDQVHESDPGFVVAWRSKSKHKAGVFGDKVMTWGQAHRAVERLRRVHPENTYWEEHIPQDYGHH